MICAVIVVVIFKLAIVTVSSQTHGERMVADYLRRRN
jgi:hypothetical protein